MFECVALWSYHVIVLVHFCVVCHADWVLPCVPMCMLMWVYNNASYMFSHTHTHACTAHTYTKLHIGYSMQCKFPQLTLLDSHLVN